MNEQYPSNLAVDSINAFHTFMLDERLWGMTKLRHYPKGPTQIHQPPVDILPLVDFPPPWAIK